MTEVATEPNPLLEGLSMRKPPDACALVIFGASGDLAQRKLFPALYSLAVRGLLPRRFGIVGVSRTEMTVEEYRARMRQAVEEHGRDPFREDVWEELAEGLCYVSADFGSSHPVFPQVDACVHEVIQGFEEDTGVFDTVRAKLEAVIAAEDARIAEGMRTAEKQLEQFEGLALSKAAVREELAGRLAAHPKAPRPVVELRSMFG